MSKYYFTFGYGQVHANGYHVISANNPEDARTEMVHRFGNNWSMQYTESEWTHISKANEYEARQFYYMCDKLGHEPKNQAELYELHEVK